jgi:hypothetical protein
MIEFGKQYKTRRDLYETRIYAVDGCGDYPVHGAVLNEHGWVHMTWRKDGRSFRSGDFSYGPYDLIEVKPRIQREVWVNVYPGPIVCELRHTKADADEDAVPHRIACVKLVIDCEEGEGL